MHEEIIAQVSVDYFEVYEIVCDDPDFCPYYLSGLCDGIEDVELLPVAQESYTVQ